MSCETNSSYYNGTNMSIGLTMPPAFSVFNSPLTSSGTINVVAAGLASQYIRGDGVLATLPTSGGGGGSNVSYYLNGGTLSTVPTYYQLSKVADTVSPANFTISSDGLIAQFLTDVNDPAYLSVPSGSWIFNMYFSASTSSGSPEFYVELYKYDGSTFTLISSSIGSPEVITNGTTVDLYTTSLAVPTTALSITDRLAIRVYANVSGNSVTLHTQDNTLCQVVTTFAIGITRINGLSPQVQYFQTGTAGSDFNISSNIDIHTFNIPSASLTSRGLLTPVDWYVFNNKQNALTFGSLSEATSSILTIIGGSGAVIGGGTTIQVKKSSSSQDGYLSSIDWSTFNSKEPAISTGTTLQYFRGDKTWQTLPIYTLSSLGAQAQLNGTGFVKASGTTISYDNTSYYPQPVGTTAQYVRGDGSLDTFPTVPVVSPSALSKVDDTNVTLTLSGTPNTALLQSVSLVLGWSGYLPITRGGTGLGSLGLANQLLRVNSGATALEYFTPSYITGNQTITLSGDVSGSGATSISTTLATITQSTGSNFVKISLDTKGRVIGNTSVTASDLNSTFGSQSANKFYASPDSSSGAPSFRALVANDIPIGSIDNTKLVNSSITINGTSVSLGSSTTIATGYSFKTTLTTGSTTYSETLGEYITLINPSGNVTLTLTPAVGVKYVIKKISSSTSYDILIKSTSGTIEGVAGATGINLKTAIENTSVTLVSDGTNWYII